MKLGIFNPPNFLTNPTIQGTVLAGTGLTMPAFTAGGSIALGAQTLVATDVLLKRGEAGYFYIRDNADTAYKSLKLAYLHIMAGEIIAETTCTIRTWNGDDTNLIFKARDNGVGVVEVARLQSAADPYFQMTLAMRLNPIATASLPATPVEGMVVYDATDDKLKVYNGAAWETVTSA